MAKIQHLSNYVERFFLTKYVNGCNIITESDKKLNQRKVIMFLRIILFILIFIIVRILVIKFLSIKLIKELKSNNK